MSKAADEIAALDAAFPREEHIYHDAAVTIRCSVCRRRKPIHARIRWATSLYGAVNAWLCRPCFGRVTPPKAKEGT